ncbi:MAG: hypothetical protein IPP25_01705 [Saprospiraceae bacterium]|nr:hypothetical protein [Candidatus Opimibacter skivensis]
MKILSHIQTILVVIFSLLALPVAFSQLADPIVVNLKSTGSSYSDQFAASTDYAFGEVQDVSSQLGTAGISNSGNNTVKVMFTPFPGAVGTTDYIVSYYTISAPIHQVTKWYRFNVRNEIVVTMQTNMLLILAELMFHWMYSTMTLLLQDLSIYPQFLSLMPV